MVGPSREAKATGGPPYNYSILLHNNGSEVLLRALATRPWWRATPAGQAWHLWWSCTPFDWSTFPSASVPHRQLTNRCKGNAHLVNKDLLAVMLRRYAKAAKLDAKAVPLLPPTFVCSIQLVESGKELREDFELKRFRDAALALKERGTGGMWIVKSPPLNRGRGIFIFQNARAVENWLLQRGKAKKPQKTWVVQKYLELPLLLAGRKFDIRLLVLVTPDRRVFMYRDSYVRTASGVYDPSNTDDQALHLVNDAVQSKGEEYGKFEDCNKLSFDEFQEALNAQPLPDGRILNVAADLWPAMRDAVGHIFCSALSQHFPPAPPGGSMFELYGVDVRRCCFRTPNPCLPSPYA